MMRITIHRILILLLSSFVALCKDVDGVFTAISSIQKLSTVSVANMGAGPQGFYAVVMEWAVDSTMAQTGDSFYLRMPYVSQVRILEDDMLTNSFDILLEDGQTFASCEVDQAGLRSLETVISCEMTVDINSYESLSGTLSFTIVFEGGLRLETAAASSHWEVGTNTVTFNGDLTKEVQFEAAIPDISIAVVRINMRGDTLFYFTPEPYMCSGGGASNGSLQIRTTELNYPIIEEDIQLYYTRGLTELGYPKDFQALEISSSELSPNKTVLDLTYGAVPAGTRIWVSGFHTSIGGNYPLYAMVFRVNLECTNPDVEDSSIGLTVSVSPRSDSPSGDGGGSQSKYESYILSSNITNY